ncbi:fibronectin type III domain-containing protein [Alistipes finegoldii DSM 17242]|uniref:Fibronectin type III domain-containing protein n=1 Tax=Alistipes finegoldii (strain DSM 17242 / JCM 16770 / CCUG 46020 / CIP 107999 / KCTC 15236 / AHN 2437) TaxID=679935 RepID=I3YQQ1_ALIFI|nr:fibronectin type III domain-containing protein [Alistipes finegoldii]AFL79319.1 fibronectin type III domain-containing protein [Alistipes finegoldii DSM 17242]
MKKSIIYILFALFSFSAAVSLTACKDDGVEISDAYKSKTPKNVKLLEYGNKSLTICWDFVRGATSYTVQLVDGDMNPVSEALCMTTADIDYHEFTDLPTDRIYYGRVRANYPYSATSDWVYVTEHDKPAMLMASVGILDLDPQLKLHAASGSTLTFEWSYTDDKATDAARSYNVELFRDEACTDLYVSWLADGKLSSGKGIFTALAGYPVVRYTFSGLDPETTYYARITNLSFADIQTPVVAGTTAQAGPKAAANTPAKAGDIVLAQDFSAFIHGGDIVNSAAGYNAVSGTDFRKTWEKAEGVNPQADGDRPLCNWATEFHIHTGGTSAEYVEALGMKGWGSSGNTSTRPGYIKCGGGSGGIGILYTPQLTALPANTTVKVSFSASAYAEGENVYGSDIVVEAVEGAEFGSNNVVSKKGTAFVSKTVDISSAVGRFETYTVTLEGLTPASRIAFSSNPAQAGANKTRFLLDDIVVTCEGETHLEQLAAPANVKFDAEAVQPDKLTLKWDAVSGAASYTVACWADGTDESKAALVEKIDGTACTLDKLTPETKYNAKVKAVAGRTATDSDWSAKASATTAEASQGKLDAPANLKAEPGFSTVALTWDAVSGATGYSVTVDNGTPQTVTDNAFTATGLTAGTSHDFSVVALAALAADNSDAATLQSKTLYVRIAAVTTSSIILEWEQAGDVSQYTVAIEEEGDPSRSARFTYDWSKASGYGSIPLRFAFNYVGTEWASAALSPSASYRLRVKAGAADSDSAWSNDITGTVARRTAPAGEVFYEDFDRFMGGDAVMTAVGVKSAKKVTSEAGLSTMLTEFTYTDWSAGGGAMNAGSGTYGDPYRLMFFKDDGWETGALVTGNGVHNAFCGSFRLGGDNANQSYVQTPAMSGLTAAANVTVTFKTAVNVWTAASTTAPAVVFKAGWCRDQFESMELYVVHDDGTKVKVGDTIAVGDAGNELAWKSHSVVIEGLLPTDKLMFTSVGAKKSRYYLDEISVVKN